MFDGIARTNDKFLDFGEVFYLVDSSYRTAAQGWSRGDRTGPLDLYLERNGNGSGSYSFRTGDYGRPQLAIQAAIDAAIDFRGDALLFTPGAYSIATAVNTVDVPDLRLLGPKRSSFDQVGVTITSVIDKALTISVDRVEVGYLRFIPLTAGATFSLSAGADNCHFHDYVHDAIGITGSTATVFASIAGATANRHLFERFGSYTSTTGGPHILTASTWTDLRIRDFHLSHGGGVTLATALLTVGTADAAHVGVTIERGHGTLRGAASTAVTNLVNLDDSNADVMWIGIHDFIGMVGFCASTGLVALNTAEAAEVGLYNNKLYTISGGTGLGTAYTA